MADDGNRATAAAAEEAPAQVFAHSEWRSLSDWRIMQAIRALFVELDDRGSRIRQTVPRDSQFVENVRAHQRVIHTGDLVASERFPMWISVDYADPKEREEASRKITVQEACVSSFMRV